MKGSLAELYMIRSVRGVSNSISAFLGRMDEKSFTRGRHMSHCEVAHMDKLRRTRGSDMFHPWMRHVAHVDKSCRTRGSGRSRVRHVSHMDENCCTRVAHMDETCRTASLDECQAATHCNTPQHIATHCNTLQHPARRCNTLQHTTALCNTRRHSPPRHHATHCSTLQNTAAHCNTLQHATTFCNTPTRCHSPPRHHFHAHQHPARGNHTTLKTRIREQSAWPTIPRAPGRIFEKSAELTTYNFYRAAFSGFVPNTASLGQFCEAQVKIR